MVYWVLIESFGITYASTVAEYLQFVPVIGQ